MNNNAPQQDNNRERKPEPASFKRNTWIWLVLFLFVVYIILSQFSEANSNRRVEVTFNEFKRQLVENVQEIDYIKESETNVFTIFFKNAQPYQDPTKKPSSQTPRKFQEFYAVIKDGARDTVRSLAEESKVPISLSDDNQNAWVIVLFQFLPLVLLVLIFWFMASRVRKQMGGPGIFGKFGGNRAKRYEGGKTQITFRDVASLKNVKQELLEIVSFLKHPERYTRLGAKIPKGVLLVGPPGTGKTLLAKAVAGEAGVPFYSISGSEFIELFVGMGASRVRELFDEAKKNAPCIVFIDEIDAVGRSRGAGLGGGHDEREQTLNQILSEMDGFESNQTVIVLAATNRPDVLDPALVRPGRFDRQVVVERPQREGRKAILQVHTKDIPLSADVDLDSVARATIGFSGADLRNLANEAALLAARDNKDVVTQVDFENAKDKITLGTLRDERMTEKERILTAYHEAGHALLALLLPESDPVQSVTIVPRGRALGVTQQTPAEEVHSYSRTYLKNRVVIMLGGRAAEELTFSEFTTGAENDLKQSTDLVERMVCRWGMSDKLGPVAFPRGEEHVFLGRELGESKHYSEHTAMLIDDEIRKIIDEAYETATRLLKENQDKLKRLSQQLLEHEILTDREIYELLDFPLPPALRHDDEPAPTPVEAVEEPKTKKAKEKDEKEPGIDPGLLGLEGA